ncbi:MAG: hypothetical protein HN467_09225 [Opitutae bacterium]|nr:hypothetical protein [Opitutae bacterium]
MRCLGPESSKRFKENLLVVQKLGLTCRLEKRNLRGFPFIRSTRITQ